MTIPTSIFSLILSLFISHTDLAYLTLSGLVLIIPFYFQMLLIHSLVSGPSIWENSSEASSVFHRNSWVAFIPGPGFPLQPVHWSLLVNSSWVVSFFLMPFVFSCPQWPFPVLLYAKQFISFFLPGFTLITCQTESLTDVFLFQMLGKVFLANQFLVVHGG